MFVDATGKLGTSGGNSGVVTSFNTRTGDVLPAANDYDFSLLSRTLADGQLSGSYSNALTLANASNLIAGNFSGNGTGLTNVPVSAGSPFYIQNGTGTQSGTSFNIDGSGSVGTNYQIAGVPVLSSNAGNSSLFVGPTGGTNNSSPQNTFVGYNAGQASTGDMVTAVGYNAGAGVNPSGDGVFVGAHSGESITFGNSNTFVGQDSGQLFNSGNQNTFIGTSAGQSFLNPRSAGWIFCAIIAKLSLPWISSPSQLPPLQGMAQYSLNPDRCQRTTVSGRTITRTVFQ